MNIEDKFLLASIGAADKDKTDIEPEAAKLMAELASDLAAKVAKPEQAVAVLLLTSVGMLGPVIKADPSKRGKMVNVMTAEYRRLLQRYLPQGGEG